MSDKGGKVDHVNPVDVDQLNDEQREVVEKLAVPVSVIAGAGTGKTHTVTHRLCHAAQLGVIDPLSTLAVTFTTSAADELTSRLHGMGVQGVQSRTFHSAALRQAAHFWPQVYQASLPPLEDRRDPMILAACERVGIPVTPGHLLVLGQEISWTKQNNVLVEDYGDLATKDQRLTSDLEVDTVADALVAYEQVKQAACVIDFDDVLLCTVALLTEETEVRRKVHHTYRHFIFDEYQDISAVQARLVELWVGGRPDVCVVGDPAQTIHHFAGSRSQYLEEFADTHQGAYSLSLTKNYRSTPEILALANQLTSGVKLSAFHPSGAPVEMSSNRDFAAESQGIVKWLIDLHDQGLDYHQMAVLYRTKAQGEDFARVLVEHGLPWVWVSGENLEKNNGIRVGTLHSAKGMEFAAVNLGGLHEGSLPHRLATSDLRLAEEKRLLYVGITRAQRFLRLSWSLFDGSRPTTLSRFLQP